MDTNVKSTTRGVEPPKPSEAEVVQTLVEIEKASKKPAEQNNGVPPNSSEPQSWLSQNAPGVAYVALVLVSIVGLVWGAVRVVKKLHLFAAAPTGVRVTAPGRPAVDASLQREAEGLLERVAAGDPAAVNQVLRESDNWTGKIQRTPKTDQLIGAGINAKDLQARAAALQAQLAADGIPRDAKGLSALEQAVADPGRRTWALWMLGALGNRGADPAHAAKIIGAYLDDPAATVRTSAVEGLALVATNETIPMLLDRFRNDPSPMVQERAACGLAEAGMYTHAQRMAAAASLVGWVDDSLLSQQQRTWDVQALHDISGENFGMDSAAWRSWYGMHR
jgi:hypothetical protein